MRITFDFEKFMKLAEAWKLQILYEQKSSAFHIFALWNAHVIDTVVLFKDIRTEGVKDDVIIRRFKEKYLSDAISVLSTGYDMSKGATLDTGAEKIPSEKKNKLSVELEKFVGFNYISSLQHILAFLKQYNFGQITDITVRQREQIREILIQSMFSGWTVEEIGDELTKVLGDPVKARAIAFTETTRAANYGKILALREDGYTGHKKYKARMDSKTSDLCKRLNGQTIPLDQHFKDPKGEWTGLAPPAHVNCFDKKTEVYTEEGWMKFSELEGKNIKIWSLNPDTLEPEWAKYKHFIKEKSDKIVEYKSNNFDTAVTLNHNQFVYFRNKQKGRKDSGQWKLVREEELPNHDFNFFRGINWNKKSPEKITIHGKEFNYKSFAKFIGWFLSEGSYTKGKNYIKISQEKENTLKILLSDMMELDCRIEKWTGGVYVFDKALIEYCKQFGHAHEKFVPNEIKEASSDVIKNFLDAFNFGDGSIKKGKFWKGYQFEDSRVYFTSSKRMADDIGELILKAGKSVSFKLNECKGRKVKFKNGTYTINHNVWILSELSKFKPLRDYMSREIKDYNDFVYDVELEKNHILLTRRNGKIVWSGNCRSMIEYVPINVHNTT